MQSLATMKSATARVRAGLFPQVPTSRSIAWALLAFTGLGFVVALLYLIVVTPTYTATMVIGPTQEMFTSSPSRQLERGGMSLLTGGSLLSGPKVITPYDAYIEVFNSRETAERLYADPVVRAGLFPAQWDGEKGAWKNAYSPKSLVAYALFKLVGRNYSFTPTSDSVQSILKSQVKLDLIDRGPMYTVSFSSKNRDFALEFLRRNFAAADRIVKENSRKDVLDRTRALRQRMNDVDVVEYRSEFVNLLMEQEKQLMVLKGDGFYSVSMVSRPSAPVMPDTPRVFATLILYMILFFLLGASVCAFVYRSLIVPRIWRSTE